MTENICLLEKMEMSTDPIKLQLHIDELNFFTIVFKTKWRYF